MNQQEELEKTAKAIGERLALLLVAADLPEDVKAGFSAMIPEMSPEEIDRLMKILEANVRDTSDIDEAQLIQSLETAKRADEREQKQIEKRALSALAEIEKALESHED